MSSVQVSIMPATSHTEAFVGVGSQVPGLIATGCHVTPIPAPVSVQMGKAGRAASSPSSQHSHTSPGGNGNGGTLVLGEVPGCVVVDLQGNDIVVHEPASAATSAAQYLVDQPIVVRLSRTQAHHAHSPSNAPHSVHTHMHAHTNSHTNTPTQGHTHTHLPSDTTHAVHTQSHVSSSNNNNIAITNSSSQADIHISHPTTHHTNPLISHNSSSHHASCSSQQVSSYSGTDGMLSHNYHRGKEGYEGEGTETTSVPPQSKSQVKVEVDIEPKWIIRPGMTNSEADTTEDGDRPRRTSAKKARQRWKTLHEDGSGAVRAGARRTKKLSNLPRKKLAARTERMEVKILLTVIYL